MSLKSSFLADTTNSRQWCFLGIKWRFYVEIVIKSVPVTISSKLNPSSSRKSTMTAPPSVDNLVQMLNRRLSRSRSVDTMSVQSTRGGSRLLGVSKNPRSGLFSFFMGCSISEITVTFGHDTVPNSLFSSLLGLPLHGHSASGGFCCSAMLALASKMSSLAAADGGVSQRERALQQHVEHYWQQLICKFLSSAAEKVFVISFQYTDVAAGDVWGLLGQDL